MNTTNRVPFLTTFVVLSLPFAEEPKTPHRHSQYGDEGFSAGELVAEHDVPPSTGLVQWLLKLRHDVRACEYEDIQVMWEMLNRNESNKNNTNNKKKGQFWKLLNWARCAPYYYMCRRG
ncbi:uncharacterized protein HKW66_Vig0153050 [Vigna angularis]|uniref:Uncharacterized protein n=1 Tax=Phaseolus angularis TaxID=3914 RepID=A0A8T0JTB0_PHAAN|nr:uncharacterized protein HKW66_Vig0153050 [Vigna angularis]